MEKVWANKSNNQKEFDKIAHFLFGVGVPNPDESGCSTVFECAKGSQTLVKMFKRQNLPGLAMVGK